jgi:hypothetical protein
MIVGICTVWETDPELPVNEIVAVPGERFAAADIVTGTGVPGVTGKLLGETVIPDGGVAFTWTLPVSPFFPVAEI